MKATPSVRLFAGENGEKRVAAVKRKQNISTTKMADKWISPYERYLLAKTMEKEHGSDGNVNEKDKGKG